MVTTEVIIAQMNVLSGEIKLREDDIQEETREKGKFSNKNKRKQRSSELKMESLMKGQSKVHH